MCSYQEIRNVSFSEGFAYVLMDHPFSGKVVKISTNYIGMNIV